MKSNRGLTAIELAIVISIIAIILAMIGGSLVGQVGIYGYIKSKDVSGQLQSVTSAMPAGALVSTPQGAPVFQASVMIKTPDGQYIPFSTDDRQWASLLGEASKGKCVSARIFPYAPWELGKAGTYHGGRLLSLKDC